MQARVALAASAVVLAACKAGDDPAQAIAASSVSPTVLSTAPAIPDPPTIRVPQPDRRSTDERSLCVATGGVVLEPAKTCRCRPDARFLPEAGCLAQAELQRRCLTTGGKFELATLACSCPKSKWDATADGFCPRFYGAAPTPVHRQACLRSGGRWRVDPFGPDSTFCECPRFTDVFLAAAGGCVPVDVGGERCRDSGGRWTDDSLDKHYCVCPAGAFADDAGRCPKGLAAGR